ncbi:hypothetical protein J8F10_24410 [Gemmata sp. G18]|uniref:Uncharacterized protein n=1 Tax=Gemmata palustris TaxID=2822762 RepID=A0ABS5BXD3_9BACT|nr:hypothetical protein [Gemmata palustris]MBP3958405.1 hypothetical protein [Gemmata palustris]
MAKDAEKGRTHARLSDEGVAALKEHEHAIPKKSKWFEIMREDYGRSARETNWRPMLRGEAVPWAMLDAFADEMLERTKQKLNLHPFVIDAAKPTLSSPGGYRQVNPWQVGIKGMIGWLHGKVFGADTTFCDSAKKLEEGVFDVVRSVGRTTARDGANFSLEKQLEEGEKAIKWTAAEFTDFMRRWWNINDRVINTPVSGVSIVLPLNPAAADRFRNGEISDNDLDPTTDYAWPSRDLLILSCDDRPKQKGISSHSSAWELFRGLMAQIAYLAHPEPYAGPGLRLISFGGTPENARRLTKYGFVHAGGAMPRTGMLTMELRRPDRPHKDALQQAASHASAIHIIYLWQLVLAHNAPKEE